MSRAGATSALRAYESAVATLSGRDRASAAEGAVGLLRLVRPGLELRGDFELSRAEMVELDRLLAEVGDGATVEQLQGWTVFRGHRLRVRPGVFVPRERTTGVLVDAAVAAVRACGVSSRPVAVADLCTGGGAVALSIAAELPESSVAVLGTDISSAAVELARENAEMLGVGRRVRFAQASLLEGVAEDFDVVVANPPYLRAVPDALRREPPRALLGGGGDGLGLVRDVLATAVRRLVPAGVLCLEVPPAAASRVLELVVDVFGVGRLVVSRAGVPRAVVAGAPETVEECMRRMPW